MSEQFAFNPSQMPQRRIEHPVLPPTIVEAPTPAPASQTEAPIPPVEQPAQTIRVISPKALERSIRTALGGSAHDRLPRRPNSRRGYKYTGKLHDMSAPILED